MFRRDRIYARFISRLLVVGALLVLALALTSCRTPGSKRSEIAESTYKLGMSHLLSGNTQTAFVKFHEALKLKPKHKEALNGLGQTYMNLRDFPKAEENFRKAVKVDASYSEAHKNLCFALYNLGRLEDAVEACKRALDNPVYNSPEKAYYNMGISYYKMGKYPDAIDAFDNAVKRRPGFIPGYYRLALSYNSNRQYGKASDTMNQAVGLDNRFQGDKRLAEDWFRQQKKNEMISPVEADQFLDILHY
ncbi:MAG: tetratricopeptide repeat protein [Thermodesulfovibrionales bacterium]|nr:tetratricopeptide repeat protein [Thermodesulfovibrionales bacterium]